MKTTRFLIISVILFVITQSDLSKPSRTPANQDFVVIPVYEGMARYIEAVRADPKADINSLYIKNAIDPYRKDCIEGGEYSSRVLYELNDPIDDIDGLSKEIELLRNSGIEGLVEEVLKDSFKFLSGPKTTVCIFACDPKELFGNPDAMIVLGRTSGSGKIVLIVHPNKEWKMKLTYVVAHEYYHSVWTYRHYKDVTSFNLLQYLLFEGRAEAFASIVAPDVVPPHRDQLTREKEKQMWKFIQSQLCITKITDIEKIIKGGVDDIPERASYVIGFHIMQAYLKQYPDSSIDEWTAMDACELLMKSGYEGSFPTFILNSCKHFYTH